MPRQPIGLASYMGLAVLVAFNLALFRGVAFLLTIPAIAVFLILLDLTLARLLIWRRSLRPFEYGFIATGFVLTFATFPYNSHPRILQTAIDLYRGVTGNSRIFHFNHRVSFIYAERAALGVVILGGAVAGGMLTSWVGRRRIHRVDVGDRATPPVA